MLVKTPLREDAMREDGTCEDAMREDGGCRVSEISHNVHVSFIDHEAKCFVKLCWVIR